MEIGRCFSIIQHKAELPRRVQTKLGRALDDSGSVANEFLDAMKKEADYSLVTDISTACSDREAVRSFHAMLYRKEETKEEQEENDDDKISTPKEEKENLTTLSPALRKFYSVLDDETKIPIGVRKAIDRDHNLIRVADKFCNIVSGAIQVLLQNLDSDRDTEKEIETAIRFFPNLLSTRVINFECPVSRAAANKNQKCNVTSVSFVPLLAKLAFEYTGAFGTVNRGGLLTYNYHDMNALRYLAT